ncbi:MAG: hypothetical protein GY716_01890 [bacterium]|nr:hypothetical protein [bacterium]
MLDRFLDLVSLVVCRLSVGVYFRRVEVVGREHLPPEGPMLLVGNHTNALVDPGLIVGFVTPRVRMLAKSTLWKNPILRPLLWIGRPVPVYRRMDGVDVTQNLAAFARSRELLSRGGAIAIFPEGISHNEPALQGLRTGAARIVLETASEHDGLRIPVVPVGLVFDARTRFRSNVLLRIGPPLDPGPEIESYSGGSRKAVRRLTERIAAALEAVTLNYDSWEESRVIGRVAELYARPDPDTGQAPSLAQQAELRKTFTEGYREVARRDPRRIASLYREVREYDRLLSLSSLRDAQVASRYDRARVVRYTASVLSTLLIRLPATLVGLVLNGLPYQASALAARKLTANPGDVATYAIVGGLVLFPLFWLLQSVFVGLLAGAAWGVLCFAISPLSAYIALRARDRRERLLQEARAYLLLRTRTRLREDLRLRRESILGQVSRLVREYPP